VIVVSRGQNLIYGGPSKFGYKIATHSTSTSVSRGNVFTATHLKLTFSIMSKLDSHNGCLEVSAYVREGLTSPQ
jgi:hypothetical protein